MLKNITPCFSIELEYYDFKTLPGRRYEFRLYRRELDDSNTWYDAFVVKFDLNLDGYYPENKDEVKEYAEDFIKELKEELKKKNIKLSRDLEEELKDEFEHLLGLKLID